MDHPSRAGCPRLLTQRLLTTAEIIRSAGEGQASLIDTLWELGQIGDDTMSEIARVAPMVAGFVRQRDRWRAERLIVKRPPPGTTCRAWTPKPETIAAIEKAARAIELARPRPGRDHDGDPGEA